MSVDELSKVCLAAVELERAAIVAEAHALLAYYSTDQAIDTNPIYAWGGRDALEAIVKRVKMRSENQTKSKLRLV